MPGTAAQLNRLKSQLRSFEFTEGRVKTADDTGEKPERSFESAFSNIAHTLLAEKAGPLLDYELGFQMVDSSPDKSRGVGCFGFRVGEKLVLVPTFILNGEVKQPILYLGGDEDLFVPLSEKWCDYITGHRPSVIGDGLNRNLSMIGVMPPNLAQVGKPIKWASAFPMTSWAREALPALAYSIVTDPLKDKRYANLKTASDFLKEAGAPLFKQFLKTAAEYPTFVKDIDRIYGEGMLTGVAKHIAQAQKDASSILKQSETSCYSSSPYHSKTRRSKVRKGNGQGRSSHLSAMLKAGEEDKEESESTTNDVKVVTHDEVMTGKRPDLLSDLSSKEREHLFKARIVVRDKRMDKDVTIAYNVQTPVKLYNPGQTNVYQILVKPDKFEKCLVVYHPYDEQGENTFCTVVSLESHKWVNIHPSHVWAEAEGTDQAWRDWWKELPEGGTPSEDGIQIIMTPWGHGTCPFRVHRSYNSDPDKTSTYEVGFRNHAAINQPSNACDLESSVLTNRSHRYHTGNSYGENIRITKLPGKKIKVTAGEVCIPEGYKIFKLKKEEKRKDSDGGALYWSVEPGPLEPGNLVDLQRILAGVTTPLKIFADGEDITFDEDKKLNKVSALRELIVNHGLREKVAQEILDEAIKKGVQRRPHRVLLKYAAPGAPLGDMVQGAPNAPPFPERSYGFDPMMGGNIPTQTNENWAVNVPDMSAARTDRSMYYPLGPDPRSIQLAQSAARHGQKEVFDTSVLAGLMKAVRQEDMVDKYLPDVMKGMDRIGRMLMTFYWRGEEFEDRYGKSDCPEIEMGLKNVFDSLGDTILSLKRKSLDSYRDSGQDADLSSLASQ